MCDHRLEMRQQRQASQEVLQRKAALQHIVDRRLNSRRVVDVDSQDSGDEYRSDSPTSSSQSSLRDSSNFRNTGPGSSQNERKSLQHLSQHKENKPETHLSAVALVRTEPSNPEARVSADSEQLASSLAGLAIADNAVQRGPTATVLAAAVATELPGEASDSSSKPSNSDTAEATADKGSTNAGMHEAGLHIAEFQLKAKTANILYKHQIEGVKWLWSLHKMRRGGILGQCFSSDPLKSMFQDLLRIWYLFSLKLFLTSNMVAHRAGDDMGLGKVKRLSMHHGMKL